MKHKHLIMDLYECPNDIMSSVTNGIKIITTACLKGELNIVGTFTKEYKNGGYSCGVFLSESHISLHTWPEIGYCALDIFLCKGKLKITEKALLLGIGPKNYNKLLITRGEQGKSIPPNWYYSNLTPNYFEAYKIKSSFKRNITPYQRIESFNNQKFGKLLFLDGDIQMAESDEKIYHEYLVHPALFAHRNPKSVLLLGGGDGCALREILRHKTVEEIYMVEIDKSVIEHAIKYFPNINNKSFMNPRVNIINDDANNFLGKKKFDIIISDLTAPSGPSLQTYKELKIKFPKSLNPGGFISIHSGGWVADFKTLDFSFKSSLLVNKWLDSFACYWQFILGYYHKESVKAIIDRIVQNKQLIKTNHFTSNNYISEVFIKY